MSTEYSGYVSKVTPMGTGLLPPPTFSGTGVKKLFKSSSRGPSRARSSSSSLSLLFLSRAVLPGVFGVVRFSLVLSQALGPPGGGGRRTCGAGSHRRSVSFSRQRWTREHSAALHTLPRALTRPLTLGGPAPPLRCLEAGCRRLRVTWGGGTRQRPYSQAKGKPH